MKSKWKEKESICLSAGNLSKQTGGSTKLPLSWDNLRHQTTGPSWVNQDPVSAMVISEHVWVEECECCVCDIQPSQTNYLFMFQPHQWSICVEWERVFNDIFQMRNGVSVWNASVCFCLIVCVCNGEREMWLWCWMRIRLNMAASTRDNKELQRLERQGGGLYLNKWKYYCNNAALLNHSPIICTSCCTCCC